MFKLKNWQEPIIEMLTWYSNHGVTFLNSFMNSFKVQEENYEYRAWLDGSFRDLKGVSAASFYISNKKGEIIHRHCSSKKLEDRGSTFAEINALQLLINYLVENNIDNIIIYGDCIHVMQWNAYQMIGDHFKRIKFVWLPRYLNFYADELCTEGYSLHKVLPQTIMPIKDIFSSKFKVEVTRRLMLEEFMFKDNKSSIHKEPIDDAMEMYLYSKDNLNKYFSISIHQAIRLMERNLIEVKERNVFVTKYSFEEIQNFVSPIQLAIYDLKRNYEFEPEEKICNVKDNLVYLLSKDGLSYIKVSTRQIKPLIDSGKATIFGEDVLVVDCFAHEMNSLELAEPPRNTSYAMNGDEVTLYSFNKKEKVMISSRQAKRLIKRSIAKVIANNKIVCQLENESVNHFINVYSLVMWMVQHNMPIEDRKHRYKKNRRLEVSLISSDGAQYVDIPLHKANELVTNDMVKVFSSSILVAKNKMAMNI